MEKIYKDRLLKLADHLKNGKLGHDRFDFTVIHQKVANEHVCESVGCAIGELPFVFPDEFKIAKYEAIDSVQNISTDERGFNVACSFFKISYGEATHLFFGGAQIPELYGGYFLDDDATREQVAGNILAFIELKEHHEE